MHFSRTHSSLITLIGLSLLSSGLLSGCALFAGSPPMPPKEMPVTLLKIEQSNIPETSQYLAKLESRQAITLKPQVSGRVTAILVEPGQTVSAGQTLIQLDASEQSGTVASSQAAVDAAKAQAKQAESMLNASKALRKSSVSNIELNEKLLARTKALYEKKASSQQELEKATDSASKAHNDIEINNGQIAAQEKAVEAALKNSKAAEGRLQQERATLGYYTIKAPFSGTIGNIPIKVGDVVSMGTELAELSDNRQLEINLNLPVEEAKRLKPSLRLRLLQADSKTEAKIFYVAKIASTSNQSILVKAKLNNPTSDFLVDQVVNAYIIWKESKGIVIPTSAVMHAAGLDFVFLASPSKTGSLVTQQRPVELGELQKNGYEVKAGLKPGDTIVSSGLQKLQDSMPIADISKLKAQPKQADGH